ncbi:hypothetical protein GCM10022247_35090 [Allokutzneria multivorans]|uniref:Uncharacterized protein n=1 Tax=Allokutzneria multivorans TaxID=1142134 RepID=A0ABP7SD33_9PSEU
MTTVLVRPAVDEVTVHSLPCNNILIILDPTRARPQIHAVDTTGHPGGVTVATVVGLVRHTRFADPVGPPIAPEHTPPRMTYLRGRMTREEHTFTLTTVEDEDYVLTGPAVRALDEALPPEATTFPRAAVSGIVDPDTEALRPRTLFVRTLSAATPPPPETGPG